MRGGLWTSCLWPGLPQLWRGQWSGLALAVGFSVLLNAVLLTSFVWTELVSPPIAWLAWTTVTIFWFVSTWFALKNGQAHRELARDSREDLFPAVLGEYLQGNWFAAEALCQRLIQANGHDVDAQLMLATVLRRSGRKPEAKERLEKLLTVSGAEKWRMEIAAEWEQLSASPAAEGAEKDNAKKIDNKTPSQTERRGAA
jgi:tetratricopeptide (TPR) repeat protein